MLGKLLSTLGLAASTTAMAAQPPYSPYSSKAANAIYNLIFCDDLSAFAPRAGQTLTTWQSALTSTPPNIAALVALAGNETAEGRVRYLAYRRLREAGQSVSQRVLLGVIVEMPLAGGLDTLAAYSEGGVRYVNQSGKIVVIEQVASFLPLVQHLFAASLPVISKIGPWTEARRAPPSRGSARLTFLVSDGLYFGEGLLSVFQRDPMAEPVLQRAGELLQAVVEAGTK